MVKKLCVSWLCHCVVFPVMLVNFLLYSCPSLEEVGVEVKCLRLEQLAFTTVCIHVYYPHVFLSWDSWQ